MTTDTTTTIDARARQIWGTTPGWGVMLADKRFAAKREANKLIPTIATVTRQQRRAAERQAAKGVGRTDSTGTFAYALRVAS